MIDIRIDSDMFDRNGKELTTMEWAKLFAKPKYKIVKQEEANGNFVSTAWLGLNRNFGKGKPVIFETMVFPITGREDDWNGEYCVRYSTEKQALAGHKRIVKKLLKGEKL